MYEKRRYSVFQKTGKSLLLVITTGFSGILRGYCTVVVKWWSKCK